MDIRDEAACAWLLALIWPEHGERVQRFQAARSLWPHDPPQMIAGDAAEVLHGVLAAIPAGMTPVVFHTHVLNQFTPQAAAELESIIANAAQSRSILWIGNDLGGGDGKDFILRLRCYAKGQISERILAKVDGHARRIVWQDR